jgi:hypothetical protein
MRQRAGRGRLLGSPQLPLRAGPWPAAARTSPSAFLAGSSVAVQGRSSSWRCNGGGTAVAERAVLEARHDKGPALRQPHKPQPAGGGLHWGLLVQAGARGTAVDCTCAGPAVAGPRELAAARWPGLPSLEGPINAVSGGGVARELPAVAPGAGGRAQWRSTGGQRPWGAGGPRPCWPSVAQGMGCCRPVACGGLNRLGWDGARWTPT